MSNASINNDLAMEDATTTAAAASPAADPARRTSARRTTTTTSPSPQELDKTSTKSSPDPYTSEEDNNHDFSTTQDDDDDYNDAAGVYAPLLILRNKRELDEIPIVPLPPHTIGGLRDQIEKSKQCNCRRSNCLKLYCECFASGIHCCDECNCISCQNKDDTLSPNDNNNNKNRYESILVTLERNPHAFRPRIIAMSGAAASVTDAQHSPSYRHPQQDHRSAVWMQSAASGSSMMGCNCKKSACLKKYCECFHAAVYCNKQHCRCTACQNFQGNPKREQLVQKRRRQAQAAATAAAMAHEHSRMATFAGTAGRLMGDAGRTYYEHTPTKDHTHATDGSSAMKSMAAGAVAGGVDVFLPPSSYAVPMQLGNGTSYAALSFGTAGPRRVGQSAADLAVAPPKTTTAPLRHKNTKRHRPPRFTNVDPSSTRETQLETAWRQQAKRVKTVMGRREDTTILGPPPPPIRNVSHACFNNDVKLHRDYNTKKKSRDLIHSVQHDMVGLAHVWHETETWAMDWLEEKAMDEQQQADSMTTVKTSSSPVVVSNGVAHHVDDDTMEHKNDPIDDETSTSNHQDNSDKEDATDDIIESSTTELLNSSIPNGELKSTAGEDDLLLCTEELNHDDERDNVNLSDEAMRELTVLAAQDTALLRDLAQRIRRKALEMAQERVMHVTKVTTREESLS